MQYCMGVESQHYSYLVNARTIDKRKTSLTVLRQPMALWRSASISVQAPDAVYSISVNIMPTKILLEIFHCSKFVLT